MAYPDQLGSGRNGERASGHSYTGAHVSGGKAHFGDVYYGVGLENSLGRLPHAEDAPFNSYAKQHEPTCLTNTRVGLLEGIHSWADGQDKRCIFWLNGLAGTGKSTIARTVARSYYDKQRLAASFFFSRGGGDVSHAGRFVTSIAVQLAHNVPASRQHICDAVAERSDIASQSLRDQWQHLVLRPLSMLERLSSYVLVVDALDECDNDNNIRTIVQLLAETRSLARFPLRVLLTSRPEVPIRHGFCQIPDTEHQDFVLHNISPSIVDHDITLFLEYNLQLVAQERRLRAGWPGAEIILQLVQSASGLFIWAATACRFIQEGKRFAAKRLEATLCNKGATSAAPEKHLNEIYITVLKNSIYSDYTDEEKEEQCGTIRHILGSIVVLFSPLSAQSLDRLLGVAEGVVPTLEDLHAILDIPNDQSRPLRLHHPSFRDFLLDKDRCGDANFWVDEKQAHTALAHNCIILMSSSLKQDVCRVGMPGALAAEVERTRLEQYLPPDLQYACLYWIQHLAKSGVQLRDSDQVHMFLKEHCLHWLEALSWMGKVSEGIYAISSLESFTLTSDCPGLYAFVHDMKRFALYSRSPIELAPLQVYYSALVFAPVKSTVKRQFAEQLSQWIKGLPQVYDDWSACLQTLEGHSDLVHSVAFSHDSTRLASASRDCTVKLWDASSGTCLQTLEGHSDSVNSVAFSHDSTRLASASGDGTVKLWDTSSGACLQTLKGHSHWVCSVAFSHDSTRLASASRDCTVKLWDASSGSCLQTLEGHRHSVNSVAFSHDSTRLASASDDGTVKLWDASSGACLQTLEGHSRSVCSVAFSHDSARLASASDDGTVKLWDASSGSCLQTLKGYRHSVNSVAFSHDSTRLASASDDGTVKLWDASSGTCLQTLEGHSDSVNSVAFSHDSTRLASASGDGTVKLWDASSGASLQTLECHSDSVNSIAFSHDSTWLASASDDGTVKLWDASSGACLQTLEGYSDLVYSVVFSHDSTRLASASGDGTVKLWDASSAACLQTLEGHSDSVNSVAFSHDSTRLASASHDDTVKLWDASSGACLQTLDTITSNVAFDSTSSHLYTDIDLIAIIASPHSDKTVTKLQQPIYQGIGISSDHTWITENGQKLLWLPIEYRPRCSATSGRNIGIGVVSGKVWMCCLS